ncbi:N-acetylmuramoyl-L-alanine amidase family protein [Bacillus rhizoplanae]|uniref:N-acetylmuramoyl-L-alanine amidase family protein n=1 Tax=Bacillus rhizoplanae TaxID=2880966 RepID=UPI003D2055F2
MGKMRNYFIQAMMLVAMLFMSTFFSKPAFAETERIDWIKSVHVTPSEIPFGREIRVNISIVVNEDKVKPKAGDKIEVKYVLPYLNEKEEEMYDTIYLTYNDQTKQYEYYFMSAFNFEQIGTWEIDTISSQQQPLKAYNSNVYKNMELPFYESMEDLSGGNITLLEPNAGWNYIDTYGRGSWYYFNANLEPMTGWLHDGGKWYYLHPNDGRMQTGWLQDNGTWYYLTNSGAMATGWVLDKKTWYYLENNGAMKTGWLYEGGSWYYLQNTGAMAMDWKEINGKWYYFYGQSGKMAASTWIGKYWVGADGAWSKTR